MNTEKMPATTHQWQLLRRLHRAGCPVNWDGLEEPCYPLRIVHEPAALGTELFPLGERTGIAFRIRITAAVGLTISRLSMSADWLHVPVHWPDYCTRHKCYCFHNCRQGEVRFGTSEGLFVPNRWICGRALKRNQWASGYLALILDEVVPSTGGQLETTLWLQDQLGKSYPYNVVLNNTQEIRGSGDQHCRFLTADELAQEIRALGDST